MAVGMNTRSLVWPPGQGAPCWIDAATSDDESAARYPCALVEEIRNSTLKRLHAAMQLSSGGGTGETYRRLNEAFGWTPLPVRTTGRC